MAIGSAPEIGTRFSNLEGWLESKVHAWREEVGDDLLGGYATLAYPLRYADGVIPHDWHPDIIAWGHEHKEDE